MTRAKTAAKLLEAYEGVSRAEYVSGPNFFGLECWELDGDKGKCRVLVDSDGRVL